MRNPFELKNTIEGRDWRTAEGEERLAFEESLADANSHGTLERQGEQKFRVGFFGVLLVSVFALMFGRLYDLAVTKHQYYSEIARGNRLRVEYLSAPRGTIYDTRNLPLATNKPSFELVVSPLDLPFSPAELDRVVNKVAEILHISVEEIRAVISNEQVKIYQSVLIKQNVGREEALIFYEQAQNLPGFRVMSVPIRDYKNPQVFAHAIGYVGKINAQEYQEKMSSGYLYNDFLGKVGLEQIYERDLRGIFGERQVEVDAKGIVKKVFGEKAALSGKNLYLNIDAELQEKLYESLKLRLQGLNRSRAAAIAMNPQNGKILALLSLPSFDNNLFAEGISPKDYQKIIQDKNQPLFNRAISGTYPPGSTVKPMVAAAALQENVITERTFLNDQGKLVVPNIYGGPDYYFYGYNPRGLGVLDVRGAIALSSDIFFYIIGGGYKPAKIGGLGIGKLTDYYRKFKLGQKLGIDLPGEEEGLVPTPEWKQKRFAGDAVASRWYLGDTYHVSIGQGDLLVTPLQLISWISTIANGGKIYRPYLVDRIEDNERKVIRQFSPAAVVGDLGIDPKNLEVVREGMRKVVTEGTAKPLNTLSVSVAGKTGTAQFDARNPYRTHAWFTAFAPYENPEIAVVVLIEDGGEGGVNSVPVVREVLDWWSKNRYQK